MKKKVPQTIKKVPQKSSVSQGSQQKLTKTESEILFLLTKEYLSPQQISTRRGTSGRAVRKVIQKLREKGVINRVFQKVPFSQCPAELSGTKSNKIRLHGMEFNVKILFKDHRYKELVEKKGNTIFVDGNTIRLYRDSLEIYGVKSFFADDPQKATSKAFSYWSHFFVKLENDLKIIIMKQRSQNIRLVKSEYAEIGNEFAKSCKDQSDKIRVYTRDDGKLWFHIDNSFNLHEAETTHPQTSKGDMQEVVQPFFNDLRDHKPPLPSDITLYIKRTQEQLMELSVAQLNTNSQLQSVISLLTPPKLSKKDLEVTPNYIG